jgi:hypothetical protein
MYLGRSYRKIFERSRNIEARKGDPPGRPYMGRHGGLPLRGQNKTIPAESIAGIRSVE